MPHVLHIIYKNEKGVVLSIFHNPGVYSVGVNLVVCYLDRVRSERMYKYSLLCKIKTSVSFNFIFSKNTGPEYSHTLKGKTCLLLVSMQLYSFN